MHLRFLRRFVVIVIVGSVSGTSCPAADPWMQARPCGPDSLRGPLRLLVPQGAYGADFRPACRAHDACYDTLGARKSTCDARFLQDMLCACEHSRHPVLCRMTARLMHRITARHGEESFRSAQAIARRNVAVE